MSDVVKLEVDRGIALVTMQERDHKNMFSRALVSGLRAVFGEVARRSDVRVVVVTGYDNYFCCGGTREELLAMHRGGLRFDAMDFHDLLLRCEVPVIAAMQGHGIGGGLAFGAFADVIVMANEAIYATNFMRYGFTPGFGATYIVPRKFGEVLGGEMLYTAANYAGWQLRERGAPMRILPKKDVLEAAVGIAGELADKPRPALTLLKRLRTARMADECRAAVAAELEAQQVTFGLDEVRARIESAFG